MQFVFEQGQTVRDQVTGFEGVITGRCDYISGCRQYLLQPTVTEVGKFPESRWLDEDRLLIQSRAKVSLRTATPDGTNGPDAPAPRR